MKVAYLTIDDAPAEEFRAKVDYLDSKGIKVIWFCQGVQLERNPDDAVYAIRKGHMIGNHSYDHPNFSEISVEEAREQIRRTDDLIKQSYASAGVERPFKLFRFPFLNNGKRDDGGVVDWSDPHVRAIQEILGEMDYDQPVFAGISYGWWTRGGFHRCRNVDCTYDSFDWVLQEEKPHAGYHDLASLLGRMDEHVPEDGRGLNHEGSNEIIMMHAFIPLDEFKALVEKLLDKGLVFRLPEK